MRSRFMLTNLIIPDYKSRTYSPSFQGFSAVGFQIEKSPLLVANTYSHHYLVTMGHNKAEIELLDKVFGLEIEEL